MKKEKPTPKAPKETVELVTYTMKAVIPTGQYANIQPEITVKATSIAYAEEVCMNHIKHLFDEYSDFSRETIQRQRDSVAGVQVIVPKQPVKEDKKPVAPVTPQAPEKSSYELAESKIASSNDKGALLLLQNKINASKKLTEDEQATLRAMIFDKIKALG
jgi:hypothetical protein